MTAIIDFGTLRIDPVDQHPGLVWIAAAGLIGATLLGTLGMPPVDLHLPTHRLGIMGPLCGMTRSVARAATGEIVGAWRYNPGGLALVAGAWACVDRTMIGRRAGRWLNLRLNVTRGGWGAITTVLVALTVNQQKCAPSYSVDWRRGALAQRSAPHLVLRDRGWW